MVLQVNGDTTEDALGAFFRMVTQFVSGLSLRMLLIGEGGLLCCANIIYFFCW